MRVQRREIGAGDSALVDQNATLDRVALILRDHSVAENLTWLVNGPYRTGLYEVDGIDFESSFNTTVMPERDAALRFQFKGKVFEINALNRGGDQSGSSYTSEMSLSVDSDQVLVARLESIYGYFGWKRSVSIDPLVLKHAAPGEWMEDLQAIVEACRTSWKPRQQQLEAMGIAMDIDEFG